MAANIPNNPPPTAPELNGNPNVNQNQQTNANDTAVKIAFVAVAAISAVALSALFSGMAAVTFAEGLVFTVIMGVVATAVTAAVFFSSGESIGVYSYSYPRPHYYHHWRPLYTPPFVYNPIPYQPRVAYRAPFIAPRTIPPIRLGGAPIQTAPSIGPRVAVGGGHFQASAARPAPFGGARVPVGRRF